MTDQPRPVEATQATPDPEAITLSDHLHRAGIPGHEHKHIRNAVALWIGTWHGATPTNADAEQMLDQLIAMIGYGR